MTFRYNYACINDLKFINLYFIIIVGLLSATNTFSPFNDWSTSADHALQEYNGNSSSSTCSDTLWGNPVR